MNNFLIKTLHHLSAVPFSPLLFGVTPFQFSFAGSISSPCAGSISSPWLLIVEFLSSLFFSYSLLDNIIHSIVLNTIFSVPNTLFHPHVVPIPGNLLVGQVRNWGITLYPFLSLIMHNKSISKCQLSRSQYILIQLPSPHASLYSQKLSYLLYGLLQQPPSCPPAFCSTLSSVTTRS